MSTARTGERRCEQKLTHVFDGDVLADDSRAFPAQQIAGLIAFEGGKHGQFQSPGRGGEFEFDRFHERFPCVWRAAGSLATEGCPLSIEV